MRAHAYSLGMIETLGLPALIAAADAAAKAADVKVVTYEGADAGIVTVYVIGDVSSVQAAVDAGADAARRVGRLLHSHVIPRPDENVPKMIKNLISPAEKKEETPTLPHTVSGLADQSINDLRKLARSYADFPLSPQEIGTAKKEELVRLLEEKQKGGGEQER
ncbi:carbon dioxide concentrating mechanism/carboxysome shell protein [Brevibacillus choshinensis]|uniref:Carbon dioxide concentrating mechanism/carboxysome shell protein n=1 Tax=Brevibacillus choshinensis TaxID=54911 RepID=A0ABR5N7Z0_BRECH|nr:BMC domain-containing protein [Brevibacillus choshinensis]KQL46725.1 carbon dioxide concentrating mechanism/carboxysome shell protein [Brevibacillus choshinensis]